MRKIVILLVLVLSIVGCYVIAVEGVDYNFLEIASYDEVKAANKELDTQISELNRKNTTEFESKRTALTTAVKNYKDKKAQYEALAPTVQQEEEVPEETTSNTKTYDVDFLWTIVGNYATEEGITIDFTFVKSATATATTTTSDSEYYTMADINFTISGSYNSLIEFIYDIEEDDRLAFEIRNFKMSKGGSDIQATFSVIGVPINNENLTSFTTQTTTDNSTNTVDNTTGTNTVDGNVTTDNTTVDNTANTANTTNTVETTGTTNTTNSVANTVQ